MEQTRSKGILSPVEALVYRGSNRLCVHNFFTCIDHQREERNMDLGFTETQEILKRTAREFLTKECPTSLVRDMEGTDTGLSENLWSQMSAMGWMGLPFSAQYGGGGGSLTDLAVLLEEMGRFLVPGPFFNTVVEAGLLVNEAGPPNIRETYIPRFASGAVIATCALRETDPRFVPEAVNCHVDTVEGGYCLNGTKLFVEHASAANSLLVSAVGRKDNNAAQVTLFMVPSSLTGISLTPMENLAREPLFEVNFENVEISVDSIVGKLDNGWPSIQKYLNLSTIMNCARSVGGAQSVLDRTVEYVKGRVQFGRPIGSFQSVQHDCADMVNAIDAARLATYQAIARLEDGEDAEREISLARILTDYSYKWTTLTAQQLHGGVAFMEEYDLQLWTRRARVSELKYESASVHRERYANAMGLM